MSYNKLECCFNPSRNVVLQNLTCGIALLQAGGIRLDEHLLTRRIVLLFWEIWIGWLDMWEEVCSDHLIHHGDKKKHQTTHPFMRGSTHHHLANICTGSYKTTFCTSADTPLAWLMWKLLTKKRKLHIKRRPLGIQDIFLPKPTQVNVTWYKGWKTVTCLRLLWKVSTWQPVYFHYFAVFPVEQETTHPS